MKLNYVFVFLVILLVSGCGEKSITGEVVKEPITNGSLDEENSTTDELSESEKEYAEEVLKKVEEQKAKLERTPENAIIIEIKELRFIPKEATIKEGMTVIWEHNDRYGDRDNIRHRVAAHYGEFVSPLMKVGENYNHTFTETGIYTYIDSVYTKRMSGTIIVE